jgi:DNA polymerase-1
MVMLGAADTETTGVAFNQGCLPFMVDLAICDTDSEDGSNERLTWEWDVDPFTRKVKPRKKDVKQIIDLFRDPQFTWVFHNAKFDVRAIDRVAQLTGVEFDPIAFLLEVDDTCCMSHALDSNGSHKLKDLGLLYCDIDTEDEAALRDLVQKARRYAKAQGWAAASHETMPVCADYCGTDVERTLMLYMVLMSAIDDDPDRRPGYDLQRMQLPVTFDMEDFGTSLNETLLETEIERIVEIKNEYGKKAIAVTGVDDFNLNSAPQKQKFLFEDLKLVPFKLSAKTGAPSCDAESLDQIKVALSAPGKLTVRQRKALEFCENYSVYNKCNTAAKYLSGYYAVSNVKEDEERNWRIIYPSFNITGTNTVRFSSSAPNLQNVGKGKDSFADFAYLNLSLRKVFGPAPGREWWAVDYDQMQLAIFAFASQEPSMIAAIRAGYDFHDFMARSIFDVPAHKSPTDGQRRIGKNVNFGFIFGAGSDKIEHTARKVGLYEQLKDMFPHAIKFIDTNKRYAKVDGHIYTMGGYRLNVPSKQSYAATNYIVQGTEGEIVKAAMFDCWEYLYANGIEGRLCLNVHDEVIFDFPISTGEEHISHLCTLMEEASKRYGVDCTVGAKYIEDNWASGVDVEFTQAV